jgi:hypothetical protein
MPQIYALFCTSTPTADNAGQTLDWVIREGTIPIYETLEDALEAVDYDCSMCGNPDTRKDEHPSDDLWIVTYNGDGEEAPAGSVSTTFIRKLTP